MPKHFENVSQRGFLFVHIRPYVYVWPNSDAEIVFFYSYLKTLFWSFYCLSDSYLVYLVAFVQSRCLFFRISISFVTALICGQTCSAQTPHPFDFIIFCLFGLKTKGHERILFTPFKFPLFGIIKTGSFLQCKYESTSIKLYNYPMWISLFIYFFLQ